MPQIAVIGAGPIGAAIAHRLAQRGRVRSILLADTSADVAAGKALDIRQSGPIEHFDTPVVSTDDMLAAVSTQVTVIADDVKDGPWEGERGLALIERLVRAGATSCFVFACPSQTWLMETTARDLGVAGHRLIGSAAGAMAGAVRAAAGLELGMASVEVAVVGRPPALVVGWSSATAEGSLLTEVVPPHRLMAISAMVPRLWPPRPYAIGSATADIVEALTMGSRRRHYAMTIVDGPLGARGRAVLLPLELGRNRVLSSSVPSLSPQELTELATAAQQP